MAFLPILLLASLAANFLPVSHSQSMANVTHETFLDTSNNVFIRWSFNLTHIDLEVTGRTLGWLAVGISPNGGMDQSDVLMGWVDDRTRRPVIQDRWNNAPSLSTINLILDAHQDWTLVSGSQNGSHTSIRAVRKLITCDLQDRPITSDTLRLIYAMNPSDPRTPTSIVKHTSRGTRSLLLLSEAFRANPSAMIDADPTIQELDLLVNQVPVSAGVRTKYHCSLVKLPPVDQKYHIVGIKPTVTAGNEGIVHHLLAYLCNNKIDDRFPNKDFECSFDRENPLRDMVMSNCTTILGVFAVGSGAYYFPPEAGLPLTPEMGEKYVFLEMHYDNPSGKSVTDSSGVTLMVTSNLRANDAAIMQTGNLDLNFKMMIPPNQEDFTIYSHCPQNCTSANFPRTGINVINVLLHTHLLGRKIYVRQIRNKREISTIKDETYDFQYQESQRVSPPRVVLPGDELLVECHFSSSNKSSVTFGGWGTPDEMCMAFVVYYPATSMKMTHCTSQTDTAGLLKLTNYPQSATFREDRPSDVEAYKAYMTSRYSWNAPNVAKLQNFYKTANYQAFCQTDTSVFLRPLPSINYTAYAVEEVCRNPKADSADQNSRRPMPMSMIMPGISSTSDHQPVQPADGSVNSHGQISPAVHGGQDHSETSIHMVSRAISNDDETSDVESNGDQSASMDHSHAANHDSGSEQTSASDWGHSSSSNSMDSLTSAGMEGGDPVSAIFDMLKSKWMSFMVMLGGLLQNFQIPGTASA